MPVPVISAFSRLRCACLPRRPLVFIALLCARAVAADYYLGTPIPPSGIALRDIVELNTRSLRPGDRVFFAGGTTFSGTIELHADDSGTASQPVELASFGSGRATVHGGTDSAIRIYNASGFVIRDLTLTGSGASTNTGAGLSAGVERADDQKLPFLRFERLEISGFRKGVELWAWFTGSTPAWPGFRDVTIAGLDVHDNLAVGIEVSGTWRPDGDGTHYSHEDVTISHCTVWNNFGDPSHPQNTGNGIVIGGVNRGTVEYCVAHHNGGAGPATGGGPFGIWAWESRAVILQYNLVHHQRSSTPVDGGAYDLDGGCRECVVQYNYSYQNEGPAIGLIQFDGASPHRDNVVRFNISENDSRKSAEGAVFVGNFAIAHGIENAGIHNNTFFISATPTGLRPPAVTIHENEGVSGVHLRNNLLFASHDGPLLASVPPPAKARFQGNNYWGGRFDLDAIRSAGQEMLSATSLGSRLDPRLQNPGGGGSPQEPSDLPALFAYRLSAGSPLISAGLDLAGLFNIDPGLTDFFGVPLTLPLSVGASTFQLPPPVGESDTRLAAISIRSFCGPGNQAAIGGFVITGTAPQTVLVRAVGPSLAAAGLSPTELLADPAFTLHDARNGNAVVAENDDWTSNRDRDALLAATARSGATPLSATDTRSAALVVTLDPGVYTFVVSGKGGASGIVLTEIYAANPTPVDARLAAISGRVFCGSGNDVAIGGFVVHGTRPRRMLIRAVGPSLAAANLPASQLLTDPFFSIHDARAGNVVVAENDNWAAAPNSSEMLTVASRIGASDLLASDSSSAALLVTLDPGIYTFVISNRAPGSGIVLTEIYAAD